MLEKSPEQKLYETARAANVATVFVLDGITYHAMPDGEIVRKNGTNGG